MRWIICAVACAIAIVAVLACSAPVVEDRVATCPGCCESCKRCKDWLVNGAECAWCAQCKANDCAHDCDEIDLDEVPNAPESMSAMPWEEALRYQLAERHTVTSEARGERVWVYLRQMHAGEMTRDGKWIARDFVADHDLSELPLERAIVYEDRVYLLRVEVAAE